MASPVIKSAAEVPVAASVAGVTAPIGRRLLYSLLIISTLMTLLTTAITLWTDYRVGIRQYDNALEQIRSSYQDSISYSLWSFDRRQLETQLQGIMNFPGIIHVQLNQDGQVLYSSGDLYRKADQRSVVTLEYTNGEAVHQLGILRISQSYQDLYDAMLERGAEIFLTQLLLVLSVATAILWAVHRIITRRLNRMAIWASGFSLENPHLELTVDRPGDERDELSYLADSINNMRLTIQSDLKIREQEQEKLLSLQHQLALAVDNAALGFCRYDLSENIFHANSHFAAQLGMTDVAVESLQHPMEYFLQQLTGPEAESQAERIRQLLQGHQVRLHDSFRMLNSRQELCFFDISLQVIRYENNRPVQVLICMIDRSNELKTREKYSVLQLNMAQEIDRQTDVLQQKNLHLQHQITQLQLKLNQYKVARQPQFMQRICHLLGDNLQQWQQQFPLTGGLLWQRFFALDLHGKKQSIDLCLYIKKWLNHHQLEQQADLHLPLSLLIEEHPPVLDFLLHSLLLPEEQLQDNNNSLSLRIHVQDEFIKLTFVLTGNGWPKHPDNQAYRLTEALLGLRYNATITHQQDEQQQVIRLLLPQVKV